MFGIRQNTYMAAEQESLLHAWLDGIEADRERAGRPEPGQTALPAGMDAQLLSAYERLDRDSPVRFGCLNTRGELGLLLDRLPNKDVAARLRDAGLAEPAVQCISGQLRSMNSRDAALTVRVSCADDRTAGAIAAALTQLIEDKERTPYLRDPVVERQDDGTIQLTGRIENLPDRVAEMVNAIDEPE